MTGPNKRGDMPHGPCPYPDCGSSDAFHYNVGGYGLCFSCKTPYPSSKPTYEWAKEEYPLATNTVEHKKDIVGTSYKDIRGLEEDVCKLYGLQAQLANDGSVVQYAFKYPNNIKYRNAEIKPNEKAPKGTWKFKLKEEGKPLNDLFGPDFNSGSSKRIYLTEGEFDAPALYQALGKTFPVKGLPTSSINEHFIKKNHDYLNGFQEIVYAGELDPAGRKCADHLFSVFPNKFWYIPLTKHKDASAFVLAGDTDELKWAALKPQRYTPENFFASDADVEKYIREENPYEYVPTGHSGLDGMIRGLVKGGITFLKAPRGTGKCLHPDQGVILVDGSVKKAKDVVVGDKLLGPDSKERNVLSVAVGREEMFKITPTKGESWTCNSSHILSLFNYDKGYQTITVSDYVSLPENTKKRYVQYRSEEVTFSSNQPIPFDPYVVGMYLGDGSKHSVCITLGPKKDKLVEYLLVKLSDVGLGVSIEKMKGCTGYHINKGSLNQNVFKLVKEKLFTSAGDKQIPIEYLTGSLETRRSVLAGLLDTDGYYTSGCFDIVQKSEKLADDICFLARSLGLAAYKKSCVKGIKSTGFSGTYYRVSISGDFTAIPLLRHKVSPRKQVKNVLRTGFSVESLGEGDYCGFEIDGDKLFLLDDFTVTHNTELARYFEVAMLRNEGTRVALLHAEEPKSITYRSMATYELGVNVRTKDDAAWNGVSEDDVIKAAQEATKNERTIIFEMRSSDDPLLVLEYCRMAATVYGADFIFVDHIQRLAYLSQSGVDGATNLLTAIGSRAAQLCKELNIGIVFISQVNDDGRTKYAGALEEEAIICIELNREVDSEDERERNTTEFSISKNRPFSKLGSAGKVYFDPTTTILSELTYDV